MEPLLHYVFRHSMRVKSADNKFNIKIIEKKFVNGEPIEARKQAFAYYESYVDVYEQGRALERQNQIENQVLDDIEFQYEGAEVDAANGESKPPAVDNESLKLSDELQERLNEVAATLDADGLLWGERTPRLVDKITSGPSVFLAKDKSLMDDDDDTGELIIQEYFLDNDNTNPYRISELMMHLDEEAKIYSTHGYDTGEELVTVFFWDPEVYYEGQEGEPLLADHKILRTVFDWWEYSQPNWWNDPDFAAVIEEIVLANIVLGDELESLINPKGATLVKREDIQSLIPKTVKKKKTDIERIQTGEGPKIEFKPDLFGYNTLNNRSFKYEAAKTICAFLNAKGGYLYIGVNDDGSIGRIDMKGMSKDEFARKFTSEVANYYLERGIADACVQGKFIQLEDKDVFRVKVNGSLKPAFLLNKDVHPLLQEFYVRREASSYLIHNPRHLLNYAENHWWKKNYRRKS